MLRDCGEQTFLQCTQILLRFYLRPVNPTLIKREGRKKRKLGLTRACETEFYAEARENGKWTAHI